MRCYRGGNKHKFEARYTEEYIDGPIQVKNMFADDIRKLKVLQKYVCDVCVWCGKTVRVEEGEE